MGVSRRRVLQLLGAQGMGLATTLHAQAPDAWAAIQPGTAVLFRHALAPGGGDPEGMQLNQCASQRNLSEAGRAQAKRLGEAFRLRQIPVVAVWSSQWCRTRDTADLAFPGLRQDQPAFNSFFGTPETLATQTSEARTLLASWRGAGVLVVVTHQVNITALTDVVPASGEGVVVQPRGTGLQVLGRLPAPAI